MPVARVSELQAELGGVVLRLLEPIGGALVVRLGLDDSNHEIPRETEEVVDPFRGLPNKAPSDRHDSPIGDRALFRDGVRIVVPAGRLQLRYDEFAAGVGFVHSSGTPLG